MSYFGEADVLDCDLALGVGGNGDGRVDVQGLCDEKW